MDEQKAIEKLLEHDRRFDEIGEKFSELNNLYLTGQDQIMTTLKRMEQELVANIHASHRHQDQLDEHEEDIKTIKSALKIAS